MSTPKKNPSGTVLTSNRRANYNYSFVKHFDAGILLIGSEIKSLRRGHGQIGEAYIGVKGDEVWLYNAYIAPYAEQNLSSGALYDPYRARKLLLNRREINQIVQMKERRGMTAVPTKIFLSGNNLAKVSFGVGHGKRQADKRQYLKNKTIQAEINRGMRNSKS